LPFAWLSRRATALACGLLVLACGYASERGAVFSAYNRIDVERQGSSFVLSVNRDFHQYAHDLSDRRLAAAPPEEREGLERIRAVYDLPFGFATRRRSALVVGAGT